ncbi:unnamed protein product, partial [Lymnaea stagnalis]
MLPDLTAITWVDIAVFVLCVSLSFFICCVNILTILVVCQTSELRTYTNTYIVSLSVTDFIVGLELLPTSFFFLPPTKNSVFFRNIHLCLLLNGLNLGLPGTSIIHMFFISVDRFIYITKPYVYQRLIKPKLIGACITFIWIFGISFSLLPQIVHNTQSDVCSPTIQFPIWYLFYSAWVVYFTSAFGILTMYTLILYAAFKQRKAIQLATGSLKGAQHISRSTARSLKFFMTSFGVFFVCMTPIVICMAMDYFVSTPPVLYNCLVILGLSNSGMNFVIFAVQNKDFRRAL